mgnify:CR=1 FL=1
MSHFFKISQTYLIDESIVLGLPSVKAADFGLSDRAVHQRVTMPGIEIGGLDLQSIKTKLIETEDVDGFWVIGSATLNHFVSNLDYKQNTLFIKPYENTTFASQYNLLGLELRKIASGEFIVRYVMPDMAAARFDSAEGDVVTSVNGTDAQSISEDKWLNMSIQPGRYELYRERGSGSSPICLTAVSSHIRGYSNVGIYTRLLVGPCNRKVAEVGHSLAVRGGLPVWPGQVYLLTV